MFIYFFTVLPSWQSLNIQSHLSISLSVIYPSLFLSFYPSSLSSSLSLFTHSPWSSPFLFHNVSNTLPSGSTRSSPIPSQAPCPGKRSTSLAVRVSGRHWPMLLEQGQNHDVILCCQSLPRPLFHTSQRPLKHAIGMTSYSIVYPITSAWLIKYFLFCDSYYSSQWLVVGCHMIQSWRELVPRPLSLCVPYMS